MSPLRLTREQVRQVDRIAIEEYGIPGIVLMENASLAVAHEAERLRDSRGNAKRAVVLCGKGNNGGDGFAVARHLRLLDWDVQIILCCQPHEISGDALTNYKIALAMHIPIEPFSLSEDKAWSTGLMRGILIDAIHGTGFRLPPQLPLAAINDIASSHGACVVAIDLPSGMDCNSGETDGGNVIRADATVTFVAEKQAFARPAAREICGEITVVGIGAPCEIARTAHEYAREGTG
jgi:NAD(P)H-hydrate epimerase